MAARGLIIAAPASGSGKTSIVAGLLAALRARGHDVSGLKIGPDYIDPGFHARASGRPCFNYDSWAMRPETRAGIIGDGTVIAEGVMGLFDGLGPRGAHSTAAVAAELGWPVVLVVPAKGMGASVAALVAGFKHHRADVNVAGVILNRVASPRHEALLRDALAPVAPVLGAIGALPSLPDRHLGLVPADEAPDNAATLHAIADVIARAVDLGALLALTRPAIIAEAARSTPIPPLGQRIVVARDAAFVFAYPAVIAGWRAAGAEISFFSPLADQTPGPCDAIYLPGGYPELHAGRLAATRWRGALREAAARGVVIYGECGGYMALGETLVDADGHGHAMAGLLPLATSFAARSLDLGYREIVSRLTTPLGPRGTTYRGHAFHYASETQAAGARLFDLADGLGHALGVAGLSHGSVFGSFAHLIDKRF